MNFDVQRHLGAAERSVSSLEREGQPAGAVILSRSFATTVEDLWNAVTNGERIPRWFLPISGELEPGGRYQFEGNAGGVITSCEPPTRVAVTWEFGEMMSWVEVHAADEGDGRARLTLTHIQPLSDHWDRYGPGATGVGWEGGLLGLAMHLADPAAPKPDPMGLPRHPTARRSWRGAARRGERRPSPPGRIRMRRGRRPGARLRLHGGAGRRGLKACRRRSAVPRSPGRRPALRPLSPRGPGEPLHGDEGDRSVPVVDVEHRVGAVEDPGVVLDEGARPVQALFLAVPERADDGAARVGNRASGGAPAFDEFRSGARTAPPTGWRWAI